MLASLLRAISGFFLLTFLHSAALGESFTPPASHARIEAIARGTAYEGGNTQGGPELGGDPALQENLRENNLDLLDHIDDPDTGMQALLLRDSKTNQEVIAFRGTWPNLREGSGDVAADADGGGDIGSVQYDANRAKLDSWAKKHPKAVVTGHSLGAALAQRYMSNHPDSFAEGVVFNAPAIAQKHAHRFASAPDTPPVTIYVGRSSQRGGKDSVYDVVSELGGQSHLPATVVEVTDTSTARTKEEPGMLALLGNSHTFTMLNGSENRILRTVPYDEFQQRRQQSWDAASTLIGGAQIGVLLADALQIGVEEKTGIDLGGAAQSAAEALLGAELPPDEVPRTAEAIANLAHGFGSNGPLRPTPAMRAAGERAGQTQRPEQLTVENAGNQLRAELRALLDQIDANLRKVDAFIRNQRDYCSSIEGADIEADQAAVKAEISEIIDPPLEEARQSALDDVANFEVVNRLRPTIMRASERAGDESTKACTLASTENAAVEEIRGAVLKSRNHAELAAELFREAEATASKVIEHTSATNASLPHPRELSARVTAKGEGFSNNLVAQCNQAKTVGVAHMAKGNDTFTALRTAQADLAKTRRALDNPALPDKVSFTLEYAELLSRSGAITSDMPTAPPCRKKHRELLALCNWSVVDEFRGELGKYAAAFQEVKAQRQKAGADLQRSVTSTRQSVADALQAAGKAVECLNKAEAKEPDLATEARQLGNLRTLSCTSNALARRVEEVQKTKYDQVDDIANSRIRLRRANSIVFNAWSALYSARQQLTKYRSTKSGYLLRNAKEELTNTLAKVRSLPSGLDCNHLQQQLRDAMQSAVELEREAESKQETFEQARHRCRVKYRSQYLKVVRKQGSYRCQFCKKDSEPKGGACIPTQQSANAWCNANNKGSGYVAYNRKSDGSFGCRLTRTAANRWCNRNYGGTGWVAHSFDKKGGFKCRRPNTSKNRRAARADCRRQAKAAGKVYAYTQFKKDGSYNCRWCERGFYYKNGKCYARQRVRQRTPRRQQGGSGPLYLCVNCGAGSVLGTCPNGPKRHYSTWKIPGENCTRVR